MFRVSSTPSAKQVVDVIRREVKKELQVVGEILLQEAKRTTPIAKVDGGRARRGWIKRTTGNTVTVANRVPYIERLENNYSQQTRGKGIMRPAIRNTNKRRVR